MKTNYSLVLIILLLGFFINISEVYSLNYLVSFSCSGASTSLDSVIVQNITKGTKVTIYGNGVLTLYDEPNAIDNVIFDNKNIKIYPGHIDGVSILSFNSKYDDNARINVYNLNGVQIAGISTQLHTNENLFELSLPNGIFIIQVATNKYNYTIKMCNQSGFNVQTNTRITSITTGTTKSNDFQKVKNIAETKMYYSTNDLLIFRGKSGNYVSTITDVPTFSKTINFDFKTNESPDFVTFTNKIIPVSWEATNWMLTKVKGYDDNYSIYCQTSASCSMSKTYMRDGVFEYYDLVNTYYSSTNPDQSELYVDNIKVTPYYERVAKILSYNMGYWKQKVYSIKEGTHTFKLSTTDNHFSAQIDALNFTPLPELAQVTTTAISSIKGDGAISGGNVVFDKYTPVTEKGLCWGLTTGPTTSNNKIVTSAGIGSFVDTIIHLIPNTTYYSRAYAINSVGISYGNEVSFTTAPEVTLPTLTTVNPTDIKSTKVIGGGNILSDGNGFIQSRGVCWNTLPNPTIDNNKIIAGTSGAVFSDTIDNLLPNTKYYIRAFATNSAGTAYGDELTFTTSYFDLGQSYQGGIIAYIDETGQHGIIAAPFDQGENIPWSNGLNISTGATDSIIGSGLNNTLKIVTAFGSGNYAAKVCYDLVLNGYDDWFLPSIKELEKLYITQKIVGGYNGSCSLYLSSTEYNINESSAKDFFMSTNGVSQGLCRGWDERIRAIRYF